MPPPHTSVTQDTTGPPLACIFGIPRLYFTCILPVSPRILGIPLYPCINLYYTTSSHYGADPLYPAVSWPLQDIAVTNIVC